MAGNPTLAQARFGFETGGNGLGDVAAWNDFRFRSETIGADFPTIADDSIAPAGEEEEGLESKITPGGAIPVNWMAEDHAQLLAAYFGNGASPVETPGGSGRFLHRLAPTETAETFGSGAIEISRDLGRPTIATRALIAGITFAAGPRGLLNGAIEVLYPRFHYFDASSQETGASTNPYARGLYKFADLQESDADVADLFVEVTAKPSATSGFDFDVKAKLGTATTYDGAAIPVKVGLDADGNPRFYAMKHTSSDVHVGQSDELPVEVHFPTDDVSVLDEWRIPRRRPVWAQSLPLKAAFNEISTFIKVDDETRRVRDFSLTARRGLELDEVIGGRFVDQILERGTRVAFGSLNRRALDRYFLDKLIAAETFQLRVEAKSTEVGSSGQRRRLDLIALNCRPGGRTPSVGGQGTFDEPFPFRCHPSDDVTYPAALTADLYNSQATL